MLGDRGIDSVNMADVYTDLGGIQSIKATGRKDQRKALQNISVQFESMMLSMMLKSMRQANNVFSENNPLIGKEEKFYRDMFDQQLALSLGKKGSVGIADAMFRQLERTLPAEKSADSSESKTALSSTKRNIDQQAFAEMVSQIRSVVDRSGQSLSGDSQFNPELNPELAPQGEVTSEEKFTEIDLWLSPNQARTVDVLDSKASRRVSLGDSNLTEKILFDGSPERFVQQLYPHAEKAAEAIGVNPEVLLAQAALETGWGKKLIQKQDGESSFNLFNIKAGKAWGGDFVTVPTLEYRDGIAVKEHAAFRSYSSPEESFSDYVNLISENPRYERAIQNAEDPKRYVRELKRAGYATDPEYAEKIIEIMNSESMKKTLSMNAEDMPLPVRS